MRKEDFFEILGELDDDIVKGAKTTMKKMLNWKVGEQWQLACALLLQALLLFYSRILQQHPVEFRFPVLAALLELMLETAMG